MPNQWYEFYLSHLSLCQGTELILANEDFTKKPTQKNNADTVQVFERLINAVIYLEETVSPQVCDTPEERDEVSIFLETLIRLRSSKLKLSLVPGDEKKGTSLKQNLKWGNRIDKKKLDSAGKRLNLSA